MSDRGLKSNGGRRLPALLVALSIGVAGVAWAGCGGGSDSGSEARERIEKGAEEAKQGIEKGKEEVKKGFEKAEEEVKQGVNGGSSQAQKGIEKGKEEAQKGIEEAGKYSGGSGY